MPVQDNENKRTNSEVVEELDENKRRQEISQQQDKENSVQKSGKLLPFLNAKAEHHQSRIDTIDEKIATKQNKIARNEAKIEKLSAKADRLEDKNKMLKATLGNLPGIGKMIESNEQKIQQIREEKIPKRQKRIAKHTDRISQLSEKRDVISHKLNRVLALNDTIKSFSIGLNKERREVFADAMSRLNAATADCLSDKRKGLISEKNALFTQYNDPKTFIGDKLNIQKKISEINERISALDSKIMKIARPESHYAEQTNDMLDASMKLTEDKLGEMVQNENISMPDIAESVLTAAHQVETLNKAQVAEIADKFNFQTINKVEEQLEDDYNMIDGVLNNGSKDHSENWLADMVDEGKAEFTEDVGFKINPDYYKELPRNGRHIETMTEAQATAVMSAMTEKNIAFSAASRGEDNVKITVSKSDASALNEIMQSSIGKNVVQSQKSEQYQTVNPDYYKSLPKDQRFTRVEAKDTAREIVKGLQQQNISYSAVVRKNNTVAVTVSKDNATAYRQIESAVKGERAVRFVNPEFFKSLPKQERFTQRMDEGQARTKSAELSAKRVEHSAVLNGEKSAVTVAKKDSRRAFFSRSNMQRDARRISGKSPEKPQPTKKRGEQDLG